MAEEEKKPVDATALTAEEIKQAEEDQKRGIKDIRLMGIEYAKRFNGYPFIGISRLERMPDKNEKGSVLYNQLIANHMLKNIKNPKALDDFMDTYGNGKLVFFQAFAECPTLGPDGLYNSLTIDGRYIKHDLVGYYVIADMDPVETKDEVAEEGYSYFYRDQNDMLFDIGVNVGIPLKEYHILHEKLYKRRKKPEFEPIIIVKQGKDQFGMIVGDPYVQFKQAVAEVIKQQVAREQKDKQTAQ